jgi:Mg2+-importing ATPase
VIDCQGWRLHLERAARRLGQRHSVEKTTAEHMTAQEVLEHLKCSEQGLSQAEASQRAVQYGPNALTKERTTALRVLVRQFQSALIYFLVVAAVIAFASNDLSDGVIITAILLINAALGFSQEYRSERAVEKLSHLISNQALVKRAGASMLIDVADLVPGDIVTLKEGDVVPADIKLLWAENIEVDESQLTGESVPVPKLVQTAAADSGDSSVIFAGSVVDEGEVTGVVYATADETSLGKIAALSSDIRKVTQYEKSLRAFSTMLMKIIGTALAVTLVVKIILEGGTGNISVLLIFLIALAVAVVPEALPVIATLTLSRGALKLAKEKVVVKRLSSLQDLGNVTLLCTDKTGTLTEGRMTIQRLVASDDALFQTLAYASTDRSSLGTQGTQTSFDAAFEAFIPEGIKKSASALSITHELPFDPKVRRRRVFLADTATGKGYLVVIGSAETLLEIAHCDTEQAYRDQIAAEGREGMRHLAIAYREIDPGETGDIQSLEKDLEFLGFVALSDPLRSSTRQVLSTAQQLGVAIKILTGDSTEVAGYVAREVGLIPEGGKVYSGDELLSMSPADFIQAATECSVFARVSPEQKFALIHALKTRFVVGYQGDGINDAPALKLADVAIAVDSATEVAKASADIILLDSDLGVIVNAIKYGRAIFANISKYIKYTMVGNFGNFFALAILYLLATDLPLLPRQVLLISLLTDLPLVAISTDSVSSTELEQPDRYSARALLSVSLVLGTLTAFVELIFFATLRGQAASASQTNLYLFLSLTQLVVIVSIRNRDHFWRAIRPSGVLISAMIFTGALALAIPYVGPTARLFSFSAPSLREVGVVLLASALYVLALDTIKVWFYKLSDRNDGLRGPGWFVRRKSTSSTPGIPH